MIKKNILFIFLLWVVTMASAHSELETIRCQFAEAVLHEPTATDTLLADFVRDVKPEEEISDQMVQELSRLYPFDKKEIDAYLKLMRPDGSWSDINYADQRRSGWEPRVHAERALQLAKLYQSPSSPYYHSEKIRVSYQKAINYWAKAKIRCLNWWYNEIGIPKTLGDSYMLMYEEMSPDDIQGAIEVLDAAKIGGTGQNRVWLSGVVLVRAILQNDTLLARQACDAILDQVVLGNGEGIKPDWSFHQHGAQLQFGNYGLAFISDMSFYARILRGTSFAMSDDKRHIINQLMDQGYRWIVWNRYMDVNALGRQFFHNAQVDKAYSVAFSAQNLGMAGFPAHGNPLVGHRYFNYSDYTVHRRPTWMASLKMASERFIGTEQVNEDNLLGFYLADGATYYYVRGDEYDNVFPLWNWHLIPGTTTPQLKNQYMPRTKINDETNHTNKVYGTSVGEVGMSAMELNRLGTHAKKTWIFTDDYVLCLGAGIYSDSTDVLYTCVDQRNAHGDLEVVGKNKKCTRFYHDGIGYVVVSPDVEADITYREGRWADNMGSYDKDFVAQGKVMQITIPHHVKKKPCSYMYIVMPDCSRKAVEKFSLSKEVSVVKNDDQAQIVILRSLPELVWIAAYEAGSYKVGSRYYHVTTPGVYAFRK